MLTDEEIMELTGLTKSMVKADCIIDICSSDLMGDYRLIEAAVLEKPKPGVSTLLEADARRIVACVNALKNVSTEWLEAQNGIVCLGSPIKDRFLELEKQRDELLAALEKCRFALEPYDDIKPRDWKSDRENLRRAHQTACGAIASVKGESS